MIIHVIDKQSDLKISPASVQKIVTLVIQGEKQTCDEVSVYLIETEEMCELHERFFGDPSPTDCISLPMDEEDDELGYRILGDVFICPETAVIYAKKHPDTTPEEETTLYIIHGILHLLGYDDIEDEDIAEMRKAETRYVGKTKAIPLFPD